MTPTPEQPSSPPPSAPERAAESREETIGSEFIPPPRTGEGIFYESPEETAELLRALDEPRNPDEHIHVGEEREEVRGNLDKVGKLIAREKGKEAPLGEARAGLGIAHESGPALKELERARERLEEEQHNLELAGQWNDVLGSFETLSGDEVAHIAEHGTTSEGKALRDKHDREIRPELAQELGRLYQKGGRRITWGDLDRLRKVVDRILKDIGGAVKDVATKLFGIDAPAARGGNEASSSAA